MEVKFISTSPSTYRPILVTLSFPKDDLIRIMIKELNNPAL